MEIQIIEHTNILLFGVKCMLLGVIGAKMGWVDEVKLYIQNYATFAD